MAVNLNGIDLSSGTPLGSAARTSAVPATTSDTKDGAAAQQGEVSITSTAALLAHVQQSLSALPAVDEQRVSAISKAIAAGTYSINSGHVARGLLQSERDLTRLSGK